MHGHLYYFKTHFILQACVLMGQQSLIHENAHKSTCLHDVCLYRKLHSSNEIKKIHSHKKHPPGHPGYIQYCRLIRHTQKKSVTFYHITEYSYRDHTNILFLWIHTGQGNQLSFLQNLFTNSQPITDANTQAQINIGRKTSHSCARTHY